MGHRILARRGNGKFRTPYSLEELGFDVAKGPRTCNVCGETWNPVLVSGVCSRGHADSREADAPTEQATKQ